MITVTELRFLADAQTSYHILKPWWDVFWYYITMVMLMIAVLAGALQLTQSRMLCLPCKAEVDNQCTYSLEPALRHVNLSAASAGQAVPSVGIRNDLHRQQYAYIDAVCYEKRLHWFAKFFPYLVFLHSIIFAVCSNFWLHYPSTSSRLEHFVAILYKCFDSPWTTRALSEAVAQQTKTQRRKRSLLRTSGVEDAEARRQSLQPGIESSTVEDDASGVLDKREGEQAKALFERVRRFKFHVEQKDIIYRLYMKQIVMKVIALIVITAYVSYYLMNITFEIDCIVDIGAFTGYRRYQCVYSLAVIFKVLATFYVLLVFLYGYACFYSLWWMLRSSLKQYSFEAVREKSKYSDIPDVQNDFAFILHLADQYDPLYAKRFSIFLSEVSENKLKQINLNNEWTVEMLKNKLRRTAKDKMELHMFMLSGLPDNVYELNEIEVLILELIPDAKLTPMITQLVNLKELHIYHSTLTVDLQALSFLAENLETLHLKFTTTEKIPSWLFLLKKLKELYLAGSLENYSYFYIEGLQDLKNLKSLYLKSSLPRIPPVVTDLLPSLEKLSINNEGNRLIVLISLKKMINLTCLELINCDLERIPHSIFSLRELQEIDFRGNNFKTIEEIISFQHLQKLTCLKLWHNSIAYIPIQIGVLANLEQLYLNHNNIEVVPLQLFLCNKLRVLDISYNNLSFIPEEIQLLKNLQYFAVTKNSVSAMSEPAYKKWFSYKDSLRKMNSRLSTIFCPCTMHSIIQIETLPDGLFKCSKLQYLLLGKNSLMNITAQVGDLMNLIKIELIGNQIESLPPEIEFCQSLKANCIIVETHVLRTLPSLAKENTKSSPREKMQ